MHLLNPACIEQSNKRGHCIATEKNKKKPLYCNWEKKTRNEEIHETIQVIRFAKLSTSRMIAVGSRVLAVSRQIVPFYKRNKTVKKTILVTDGWLL